MAFCRYCGSELVNGQCSCYEFQASMNNASNAKNNQYQEAYQKTKDPFIIPSFNINFSSVSGFISSMRDQSGMSEPTRNLGGPYEHNVPIVPDCIQPEENEIVVKQYNIAKLRTRIKFMKEEGRLMVTNRRVLFRAAGTSFTGNILQEHQFNLDEIAGIEMHKDYKFSFLNLFGSFLLYFLSLFLVTQIFPSRSMGGAIALGIILGFLGLVPTFIVYKHFWLKLLCVMISNSSFFIVSLIVRDGSVFFSCFAIVSFIIMLINLLIVCFVPNLVMKIKTKGATGAIVIGSQKTMFRRQTGDDYSGFVEVLPWEDTIMAMNELGTMIDDLQKQGDYAIEKWSR